MILLMLLLMLLLWLLLMLLQMLLEVFQKCCLSNRFDEMEEMLKQCEAKVDHIH